MKILVLSDSHSSLGFMRSCVDAVKPDAVVHLGDHYEDGQVLKEEYPHIPVHQVPGNCDRYRCGPEIHRMLCYEIGGVMLYMTHGHNEQVKSGIGLLVAKARAYGAKAALYGHTHQADCHREEDGMWVLNPGSCGYGGSVGLILTEDSKIIRCRILTQESLEEML